MSGGPLPGARTAHAGTAAAGRRLPRWASLFGGALYLAVADGAAKGASAVLALLIARFFGPAQCGEYAAVSALIGLFMMVTALGFEQELTRRAGAARERLSESMTLALASVAASCLAAFAGIAAVLLWGPYSSQSAKLGLALAGAIVIGRFHGPFRHYCLLIGASRVTALIQGLSTLVLLGGALALIWTDASLRAIALWQCAVAGLALCVWLAWIPRSTWRAAWLERARWLGFLRASAPFGATNALWIAYFNFAAFWLSRWKDEQEVGLYAGVFRIIGICYIAGYALANSFAPELFRLWQTDRSLYRALARRLLANSALAGVLLSAALFVSSGALIRILIGDEYLSSLPTARVLSLSVAMRMINFALCEILSTSLHQGRRILWESVLLGVHVVLNLALIPGLGGLGSAWALFGAELVLLAGGGLEVRAILSGAGEGRAAARVLPAALEGP